MSTLSRIAEWLRDPALRNIDPDSIQMLEVHEKILSVKKSIRDVFTGFYQTCFKIERVYGKASGLRLELGSGTGFVKFVDPSVITTDLKHGSRIDSILDATSMGIDDATVSLLLGLNMFHHIPDPERFFDEVSRVLMPGGILVLIEPWHGPLASVFYKNLFHSEGFDKVQEEWMLDQQGPMVGANQALSWIVFHRDREKLSRKWPSLQIVHEDVFDNYLRYLLSGGLNFRQLVPGFLFPAIRLIELGLRPLRRLLGLHHIIVIRKSPPGEV